MTIGTKELKIGTRGPRSRGRLLILAASLVLGGLAILAVACGGQATLPKDVLARVGTVEITVQEFNRRLADFEAIYPSQVPDKKTDPARYEELKKYVLDDMICAEIARQRASALGITVTEKDIQDQIDLIIKTNFGGDRAKFEAGMKERNLTLEQLKADYSQRILLEKAKSVVTKDVTEPTADEVAAYYEANKSKFMVAETRTIRHILIAPDSNDQAGWEAALATANKVRSALLDGADWKTEAATYSDDPVTKDKGGSLGTIARGHMPSEFDEAAFSLKEGEISQPVKTAYGYHIIQVTAIVPSRQLSLEEGSAVIKRTLLSEKKDEVWHEWLRQQKIALDVVVSKEMQLTTTTSG